MCGLFGFFSTGAPIDENVRRWAVRAKQALQHRGPDGSGIVERSQSKCLLGHTRLSIIDVTGGAQPLSNEDGTIWVVFNGEVYNFVELRTQLSSRHQFRTESDTEVLVHLYEEKGESLVDDLVGMFAFAILDERQGKLLLARDRFGEKPLYYAEIPERGLIFASELKGMVGFPGLHADLDYRALAQYLALGYVPAPSTHLAGAKKLRASEFLTIDRNSRIEKKRYWGLRFDGANTKPEAALLEEFDSLFTKSVELRLRSDVPLGAFLSGGIDSTLVVAQMRKLMPEHELRSFCAGFNDSLLDERPYARTVASLLKTVHEEVAVDERELIDSLWQVTLQYDEPYADYSCLPTYAVCSAASRHLKVMISGDGADELFGGYSSYYAHRSWDKARKIRAINHLTSPMARVWPHGRSGKGVLEFLSKSDNEMLRKGAFNQEFVCSLVRPEFAASAMEGIAELDSLLATHAARPYPRSLMEVQATDLMLPEQLMTKVDRASMKASLESRSPFLDHRLAEFAATIPTEMNIRGQFGKALLRKALPKFIPETIRWRAKRGFTPPLATWFRNSLRQPLRETIENPPAGLMNFCDPAPVRAMFDLHLNGKDDLQVLLFRWMVLSKHLEAPQSKTGQVREGVVSGS